MDKLAAMETFVRVAEAGSFTAVADQLGVARSAITRQIAALEGHLGVRLIARSARKLALTQEGQAFLARSRSIIDSVGQAEAELAQGQAAANGLIRATVPMSFGLRHLWPVLTKFSEMHPQVAIDLDFSDQRVDLIEEGIDIGIRITGELPDTQVARRIGVCRFAVVASPGYLARNGTPAHPRDLREHECLNFSLSMRSGWQFEVEGEVMSVEVGGRISANSGDALQQAAINGLGIARQPTFIASEAIKSGHLVRVLGGFNIPEIGIYAVFPGNRFVPLRVRRFVDFLADYLNPDPVTANLPYWDIGL